jgi:hypothetical protein
MSEARYRISPAASPRQCFFATLVFQFKGQQMSKGNKRRGNKEAKKPKQTKPKMPATADSNAGKSAIVVAGKKLK